MSSMYSLLGMGARSFLSFQSGMASAGHNISNAGTAGFRRTRIDLRSELAPLPGGVRSLGLERIDDPLLSRRERRSTADLGYTSDLAAAAAMLESSVNPESGGLTEAISDFFSAVARADASPTDPNHRRAVIESGRTLAEVFQELQSSVRASIRESEERIAAYAEQANAFAAELAELNEQVGVNPDPTLLDRRDQVASELASLTGGSVLEGDHGYRFQLDDGTVLVDGHRVEQLDLSSSLGGKIGGQIEMRDRIAPGLAQEIDQVAYDLATEVNAIHQQHAGLDGVAGRDFFVQPGGIADAAASFAVDPALLADHTLLAAGDPNLGPGSNAGLSALTALGGRFSDRTIDTIAGLGREVAGARRDEAFAGAKADTLATLRDSLSGVSIEEEMVRLSEFQRAAEASMKFVQTVDSMLEEMIRSL